MFDLYNTLESYNIMGGGELEPSYEYLEIDADARNASGKLTKIASSKIANLLDRAIGFIKGIIKKIMSVLKTGINTIKSKLSGTKLGKKISGAQINKIRAGKKVVKLVNLSGKYLKLVIGGDKYLVGLCNSVVKSVDTHSTRTEVESNALHDTSSKNIVLDCHNYKNKCDHAFNIVSEYQKSAPRDYMISETTLKNIGTILHNQYKVCNDRMKVLQVLNLSKSIENSKNYNHVFDKYVNEHINNLSNNLKRAHQVIVNIVKYLSGAEVTTNDPVDINAEVVD